MSFSGYRQNKLRTVNEFISFYRLENQNVTLVVSVA